MFSFVLARIQNYLDLEFFTDILIFQVFNISCEGPTHTEAVFPHPSPGAPQREDGGAAPAQHERRPGSRSPRAVSMPVFRHGRPYHFHTRPVRSSCSHTQFPKVTCSHPGPQEIPLSLLRNRCLCRGTRKPSRRPRMVCADFPSGSRCHGCLERLGRACTCGGEGPRPTPGDRRGRVAPRLWRRQLLRPRGHGGVRERYGPENLGTGQQHAGSPEHRRNLQIRQETAAGDPGGEALD